ncbi:CBL-interacting serine/threonine-protein kinase 23 [Diplonema papillatum]|nr:CBL-interacting serine/threonine-protein kinase 23 [Diplonema papillatum]
MKQVGSWVLRSVLGHGSFGEVYYATHAESSKKVAIKVCGKQMLAKGQGRTLLQREIATMKALDHPNVLMLYEVLETTKRFYLVIELVTKGELFNLIQDNKKFNEATAQKYFSQLMDGVHYCHEQGIVHRDLKPQNLLLTEKDEVKIADFGFSRFQEINAEGEVSKSLRLQTQCGTPNYAAPEIFLGQGYSGFRTDIWSCGVILYVMLAGHVPFKPANNSQGLQGVIMAIVQGTYQLPPGLSPQASDMIKIILKTNPDTRATMNDILAHQWLGKKEPSFKVPKITISDDEVRNSIVAAGDDIEVGVLEAGETSNDVRPAQRADERTLPSSPAVGSSPATEPKANGLNEKEWGPVSRPVVSSPTVPGLPPSSPAVHRARGATFSRMHLDPEVEKLLHQPGNSRASFDQLGRPKRKTALRTPSPIGSSNSRGSSFDATSDGADSATRANRSPLGPCLSAGTPDDGLVPGPGVFSAGGGNGGRTAHVFKRKHWHTPHRCFHCAKVIYGVGKQGFSCILCECPVHVRCVDASSQNSFCEQYRAARTLPGKP